MTRNRRRKATIGRLCRGVATCCSILALAGMSMEACAPQTRYRVLSTFIDGMPPYEEWLHPTPTVRVRPVHHESVPPPPAPHIVTEPDTRTMFTGERPAIEKLTTWDQVAAALPQNPAGGPDWSAALSQGVIKPVSSLSPGQSTLEELAVDVALKGGLPVTFPHAPHTNWLACDNCHTDIFQMQAGAEEITMKDMVGGKYCGVCHGKVAFGVAECGRCHAKQENELDLDVTLKGPMPVKFPHAPHTRWLPCDSCHTKLFAMQAGADKITMDSLNQGKYCGACHGSLAFGLTECGKCHLEMAQ